MTIGKLLYILGIILIIFGLISGINFYMKFNEFGRDSNFSYTLNFGKIIAGIILVYLGNRLKSKEV
jgi:hypothetical protein